MTDRTGGCLCGAVRYVIRDAPDSFGACHCSMCQRFSGGVFMALTVPADRFEIAHDASVVTFRSSDWAARSFCGKCGSSLWYRLMIPSETPNAFHVAFGTLDDKAGMRFAEEICVDTRPAAYSFAEPTVQRTTAEVVDRDIDIA